MEQPVVTVANALSVRSAAFLGGGIPVPTLSQFVHVSALRVYAYPWDDTSGWGSAVTGPFIAVDTYGVTVHPSSVDVVMRLGNADGIIGYPFNGSSYSSAYAGPATSVAAASGFPQQGAQFSPSGKYLGAGNTTGVRIVVWPWTVGTGFGTKFADPATGAPNQGTSPQWSLDENFIAMADEGGVGINVWPWSNSGFGTKFADPASNLPGNGAAAKWSASGLTIFVGGTSSPYINAYAWSLTGFGTKYANPASPPATTIYGIAVRGNNAVVIDSSPRAYAWDDSTGFGTAYTAPVGVPATPQMVDFNRSENVVFIGFIGISPRMAAYPWDDSTGWGTKYADPSDRGISLSGLEAN